MDRLNWVKDLVEAEKNIQETGFIDIYLDLLSEEYLLKETLTYMEQIKELFTEAVNLYNELNPSPGEKVKLFSISRTQSDFMLLRNDLKFVFSIKKAGQISIKPSYAITNPIYMSSAIEDKNHGEVILMGKVSSFGTILWTFNNQNINLDSLVRYYIVKLVRESLR